MKERALPWLKSDISRWFWRSRWRWCRSVVPLVGARIGNERLMAVGGPVAVTGFALTALSFAALTAAYAQLRFLGGERLGEFPFAAADALQDHRHLGQPRRLDAALGADPDLLRRAGRRFRRQSAGDAAGQCAGRAGLDRRCLLPVHPGDLQPVRPAQSRRRSKAATSIRSCRISASPSIRRCSISAMSASRSASPSAVAALIEGRIDAAWARWVRPWTLAAWMFLTGGIAMGSYWAYYELGWGGFWFWDPVENASFMPWLAGTALLHSAHRHGKALGAEDLDGAAGDPDLLAVAARHLPGALRRADLGARLRHRSDARRLHPRAS